uniref:SH3 domain-containing protein n=1 Tax=Electrophorus electricus TaxID=8005 RepID=A0A4W4ETC8_ELEEL
MSENENRSTNTTEEFIGLLGFTASGTDQLDFSPGDRVVVHAKVTSDWWWAELGGCFGYVPSGYLHPAPTEGNDAWQDEEYFWQLWIIGKLLLVLRPRTETYKQVIVSNSAVLREKVILDLGCGTGIISLFCGQLCGRLVKLNGCEGLVLPSKVDVLVSGWMGNFGAVRTGLLWLEEGGLTWPSSASLGLVPCQAHANCMQKVEFWENLYGLDFSCLWPVALKEFFSKPKFSHRLAPEDCLSVITLDMHMVQVSDLEKLRGEFCFPVESPGTPHAFSAWFVAKFNNEGGLALKLSTGPCAKYVTHYYRLNQTLLCMLDTPITVEEGDCIGGSISLNRNPVWRRHISHRTVAYKKDKRRCIL